MNITFIAPPAAGKGTQSALISEEYGIPHISTGDLLRNSNNKKIKELLKTGSFVDDSIITELLQKRLSSEDCNKGFVLDGYPRNIKQVEHYEQIIKKTNQAKNIIIVLDLDKKNAENRIVGREVCPNCGEVYNKLIPKNAPTIKGICDKCHQKLIKREDDSIHTFQKRMEVYEKETKPLIEYFEKKGILYHVDSNNSKSETFEQIKKIIGGFND